MDNQQILLKLQIILADIIDDENLTLTEDTTPADVEEWDSLAHFQLVVSLQNEYHIHFSIDEIQGWISVGDIVNRIQKKITQQ